GAGYRGERQRYRHCADHGGGRDSHSVQLTHERNVINAGPRLKSQRRRRARLATSGIFETDGATVSPLAGQVNEEAVITGTDTLGQSRHGSSTGDAGAAPVR